MSIPDISNGQAVLLQAAIFERRTSAGSEVFASLGIRFTDFRENRHHTVDSNVSLEHFHATDVTV